MKSDTIDNRHMPKKARDICVIRVLSGSGVSVYEVKNGRLCHHRDRQRSRNLRNLKDESVDDSPVTSPDQSYSLSEDFGSVVY